MRVLTALLAVGLIFALARLLIERRRSAVAPVANGTLGLTS
jgi:hypothetical protein